jgi:PAS domain S-box-containing protein
MLGLKSPEDIIGKTLPELVRKEYVSTFEEVDNEIMSANQERTLEESIHDSAGNFLTSLTRKTPLHDDKGEIIGLVGISLDITEQKKMADELKNAKQMLEEQKKIVESYLDSLLAHLPEHFYWTDLESRVLYCNEKQAKSLGFPNADALIGKNIYDVAVHLGWEKEMAGKIRTNDIEVMKTGTSIVREETITLEGKQRYFLSYKNPLPDKEKNIIGIFGVTVDITERKKMEAELREAKEKAEAALQAKEIAETENREKSKLLKNVLEELQEERYYLSGEYQGTHLTQREAQCLVCIAHGHSIKQIGKKLELSPRTVEVYLNRVKVKLKCNTKHLIKLQSSYPQPSQLQQYPLEQNLVICPAVSITRAQCASYEDLGQQSLSLTHHHDFGQ